MACSPGGKSEAKAGGAVGPGAGGAAGPGAPLGRSSAIRARRALRGPGRADERESTDAPAGGPRGCDSPRRWGLQRGLGSAPAHGGPSAQAVAAAETARGCLGGLGALKGAGQRRALFRIPLVSVCASHRRGRLALAIDPAFLSLCWGFPKALGLPLVLGGT